MKTKINKKIKETLLHDWEETYKKGQLGFWMLLSLKDNMRYVSDIKEFIETVSQHTITCEEQSLYRALRKFYSLEMVTYELREGNKGPERKYYYLTSLGQEVLNDFIKRNIHLFFDDQIKKLLFNEVSKSGSQEEQSNGREKKAGVRTRKAR